ncbi:YihY/virulence factor BrkB family protein [Granulicella cerasi]|uniref:YihY/virulence factor BrkB family protein n=1 Tax=Granulicella cerasi TaxID=741063 RepID=A0ABW1Z990_9BACT
MSLEETTHSPAADVAEETPLWQQPVRVFHTLRRAGMAAVEHDALTVAQAVAYSAMFALFPAMIVLAALVPLLPDSVPFQYQMAMFFNQVLPPTVAPLLHEYFAGSHEAPHTLRALAGSGIVSITGAANVMATLMEGFRRAHELPLTRGSFWPRRRRALALVPLSLLPMAAASALVVFGHFLSVWIAGRVPFALQQPVYIISFAMRWTVALAGSVGIIAVIYHLGTDLSTGMRQHLDPLLKEPWAMLRKDWSWRASLPGATVATVLWFASTLGFGWYVTRYANYGQVYGSLGAGIALLIWLYIIALSVLVGAEFNAQLRLPGRDRRATEFLWKLPHLRRLHLPGRTGRMTD